METHADADGIGTAMGRIPSGVAVLTATHGGRSTGMLASWIQQAAFEPWMVTVCVKIGRPIETLMDGSGRFILNIVGADAKDVLKHFGRGFAPDEDAFSGVATTAHDGGVILSASIAHVACTVRAKVPAGDHHIYVGEAFDGRGDPSRAPFVHVRKSAVSY